MNPQLTYAMIGGGTGAFIGEIHRRAISLDGRARLVCGAFSSTPERSQQSGAQLGISPERSYADYLSLFREEAARDDRPDFISIVTPNDTHFPIAKAALEHGFHVVLDKPATHTSEQARELAAIAKSNNLMCIVTYNYTGYPMVRQARAMVRDGVLGSIRKVFVEYHQGWLSAPIESNKQKQASWRVDPSRAGLGGAIGDIGSHAENLASFVSGLEIESLRAELHSFVDGRPLDDDASVSIRYQGGAHGLLTASQICIGESNNLSLRIYGDKGSIRWNQETPNELQYTELDKNPTLYTRGGPGLHEDAVESTRTPAGHPEGYIEGFSNIYRSVIDLILSQTTGATPSPLTALLPTIDDGLRGVRFIEKAVESSAKDSRIQWTS
ncbi:MAG: Gfo/Idh/MocA family protein [Phycisphaerales bacterium]